MRKILIASLLATALFSNEYVDIANKVSKDLLQTLGGNLKKHLKSNGPIDALEFCSQNAYNLTEGVSKKYGVDIDVKRISLKPRNPANTPSKEEAAILKKMEQNPQIIIQKGKLQTKVYKPLVIKKKACLICHGDLSKRPKLAKAIHDIYPADKATGYKMGDLRGAIVVTIKKGALKQ